MNTLIIKKLFLILKTSTQFSYLVASILFSKSQYKICFGKTLKNIATLQNGYRPCQCIDEGAVIDIVLSQIQLIGGSIHGIIVRHSLQPQASEISKFPNPLTFHFQHYIYPPLPGLEETEKQGAVGSKVELNP